VAESRRPLVVLVVLLVIAIGVYMAGASGAGRGASSDGWSNPFGGLTVGDRLALGEVAVADGDCTLGPTIVFLGACRLRIAPVSGGWPWQRVTRSVRLVGGAGTVKVAIDLQDRTLRTDLDPGDDLRLTFTRDGGFLVLACLTTGGCTVAFTEDGPR